MTPQQIQAYFGTDVVYIFDGTPDGLQQLMVANDTSYNYIMDGLTQIVYFVMTGDAPVPQDSRISRM